MSLILPNKSIIILVYLFFILFNSSLELTEFYYAYTIYSFVVTYILIKSKNIYHPFIYINLSYIFLIYFGTFAFDFFREKELSSEVISLVQSCHFSYTLGSLFWISKSKNEKIYYDFSSIQILQIIIGIGFLAFIMLVSLAGNIPILSANVDQSKLLFVSGKGIINIFFIGAQVASLLLFYSRLINKKDNYKTYLLLLLTSLFIFSTGYRSTTISYILIAVFVYFIHNIEKIRIKYFLYMGIAIILFLGIIGAFRRGGLSLNSVAFEYGIVTTARPAILNLIVLKSPSAGSSTTTYFSEFSKFLPGKHTSTNAKIKDNIYGGNNDMPELAGITPSVVGEAYLNFGRNSHFFLFVMGVLFSIIHFWFKKNMFHPLFVFLYLSIIIGILASTNAGFGTILVTQSIRWLWLLFLVPFIYKKRIK